MTVQNKTNRNMMTQNMTAKSTVKKYALFDRSYLFSCATEGRLYSILKIKGVLALGLFSLGVGLSAQSAQACPVVYSAYEAGVERVNLNANINGQTIYFCKQDFNDAQLSLTLTESQLLTGGSRAISMGNTPNPIQTFPLSNTVNLAGFTPSQLNLNAMSSNFPLSGGQYGEQNLFNFYTRLDGLGNCSRYFGNDQYEKITDYLKDNANIFQADGGLGVKTGVRSDTGNDLAVIKDVAIGHNQQTNSAITADITFYHANAGQSGQYFTSRTSPVRFCWVGVSTRMDIKPNVNAPKYNGDYVVNISVLTQ